MADVFISYKHRMRPQIAVIATELKSLGLDVWYDEGLISGNDYAGVISQNLRAAKSVLVCWTDDAFPHGGDRNGWVRGEAEKARERGVLVASVLEERVDLDPPWNMVQYADLSIWHPESSDRGAWRSTLRGIGALVGRPGLAALDEARSAGTSEALTAWAREYSDDPLAQAVWAKITELAMEEARAKIETERMRPKVVMSTTLPPRTTTPAPATVTPPTTILPTTSAPPTDPAPQTSVLPAVKPAVAAGRRTLAMLLVPVLAGSIGAAIAAAVEARGVLLLAVMAAVAVVYAWATTATGTLSRNQAFGFFGALALGGVLAFGILASSAGRFDTDTQIGMAFFVGALGALIPLLALWVLSGRRKPALSVVAILVGVLLAGNAASVIAVMEGGLFVQGPSLVFASIGWHLVFGLTILWLAWLHRRGASAQV